MRDRFPKTSWTLLGKAREQTDEGARAREDFARKYDRPIQEFLLVLVRDTEQARELAQDFFSRLSVPGGMLELANPKKGALRDYLQQALRNLVIDCRRRDRKRALETHPDQARAGAWEVLEIPEFPTAEAAFHREWVKATLAEALSRVRALCLKRKQEVHLDLFEVRYLAETYPPPSWEQLQKEYNHESKQTFFSNPARVLCARHASCRCLRAGQRLHKRRLHSIQL